MGISVGRIRYFTKRIVLISPSAGLCNDNIADGRIEWKCPFGRLRISRDIRRNQTRVVQIKAVGYQIEELIAERHHYCREFWSINDFILQNWGACVDTVFLARVQDR